MQKARKHYVLQAFNFVDIYFSGEGGMGLRPSLNWGVLQKTCNASALRFPFLFPLVFESTLSTLVKTKKPLTGRCMPFAEREGLELITILFGLV
jgi:hypothetical protein